MSVISELIRIETDATISFGNYELEQKAKLENFEYAGDVYKVKTFKEITKLERNGLFVYESVPGTVVHRLKITDQGVSFSVEGMKDVQITVDLEANAEYRVVIDEHEAGIMKANLGGKLSFGVELGQTKKVAVAIEKV